MLTLDRHLLLLLNGSDSPWWDQFFLTVTHTSTWIPLMLVLLYVLLKNRPWREVLLVCVGIALVVLLADRVSSGLFKPMFHRLRPSHEPALEGLVDLVDGRRGGLYGFVSSHAANTFGVLTFLGLYFRRRIVTATLLLWACLSSYSRIYMGLHYPGDILAGAMLGLLVGILCYHLLLVACSRLGQPLRPYWPDNPTLLFYRANPDGFLTADLRLLAIALILTLFVIAILATF